VQVQEVYAYLYEGGPSPVAEKRFEELKTTYGGANVCMASRTIIRTIEPPRPRIQSAFCGCCDKDPEDCTCHGDPNA
jgi:hypothetical protein